jgi:hypothetical protein
METSPPPQPAIDLSAPLYYQVVYTLIDLLPPPLDDRPEVRRARNHAAIAKVAALLPVNANEADLAAQCIAARAQAEDILRLLRQYAGDIELTMRLNAQYSSMVRTSLSVLGKLTRMQAARQKREEIEGAANADATAQHIAERRMLQVEDADAKAREAERPKASQAARPKAPPADKNQRLENHVSENSTNSHAAAFETWLSAQFRGRAFGRPNGSRLHQVVRQAMAESHLADPELPPIVLGEHALASPSRPNHQEL